MYSIKTMYSDKFIDLNFRSWIYLASAHKRRNKSESYLPWTGGSTIKASFFLSMSRSFIRFSFTTCSSTNEDLTSCSGS